MRYLYGDSTPFPYEFDFLKTLGAFMTAATRVVQLESEGHGQAHELATLSQGRVQTLELVQQLHQQLLVAVNQIVSPNGGGPRGTLSEDTHPAILEFARRIKDYSARMVQEQQRGDKDQTEREGQQLLQENERRSAEVKVALDQFFRVAILPILSSRVSVKLLDGPTPRYEIGVVFRNLGDIVTSFVLSAGKHPLWSTPRRVMDLTPGFDLVVGAKKSFFKGVVTPETVHLDEFILSRVDVHDRGAEVAIRRKLDQKDSYVFRIAKSEKGVAGEVDRLDDPNAKALSPILESQDLTKVDQLAQTIRQSLSEIFHEREAVVRVEIEGKDVYKNRLGLTLVSRLVRTFAPIVEEVVQRSPSQVELSLKLENDQGKREELYLKREDVLQKLQPLNSEGRQVFAPLGLDDWVPTLTIQPPDTVDE